jgi:hypothetical protein
VVLDSAFAVRMDLLIVSNRGYPSAQGRRGHGARRWLPAFMGRPIGKIGQMAIL